MPISVAKKRINVFHNTHTIMTTLDLKTKTTKEISSISSSAVQWVEEKWWRERRRENGLWGKKQQGEERET